MANKLLSLPIFPITSGSQDEYIESVTIPQLISAWSNISREFEYNEVMERSQGMFGLAVECDGDALDKLGVKIQFNYGGSLGWNKEIELVKRNSNGLACDSSEFYRIDINKNFRNAIPFKKMRFVIGKYGDHADCTVKARLIIL